MTGRAVRIGCASGFWGDTPEAVGQLVTKGGIDYLVFDYLAEITMSLLARARAKSPEAGYAPDFVQALAPFLPELKRKGIKVVANAGGVNPRGCREALARVAEAAGIDISIGVVLGDDLLGRADEIRARGATEMFSGAPFPAKPMSMNAYLGARPIAAALDAGADIVVVRFGDKYKQFNSLVQSIGDATIPLERTTNPSGTGAAIINFLVRVGNVGKFGLGDTALMLTQKAKDAAAAKSTLRGIKEASPEKYRKAIKANNDLIDAFIGLGVSRAGQGE